VKRASAATPGERGLLPDEPVDGPGLHAGELSHARTGFPEHHIDCLPEERRTHADEGVGRYRDDLKRMHRRAGGSGELARLREGLPALGRLVVSDAHLGDRRRRRSAWREPQRARAAADLRSAREDRVGRRGPRDRAARRSRRRCREPDDEPSEDLSIAAGTNRPVTRATGRQDRPARSRPGFRSPRWAEPTPGPAVVYAARSSARPSARLLTGA